MVLMENALYFSNYNSTFFSGFYTKGSCLTKTDQAFLGLSGLRPEACFRLSTWSANQQDRAWSRPLSSGARLREH